MHAKLYTLDNRGLEDVPMQSVSLSLAEWLTFLTLCLPSVRIIAIEGGLFILWNLYRLRFLQVDIHLHNIVHNYEK